MQRIMYIHEIKYQLKLVAAAAAIFWGIVEREKYKSENEFKKKFDLQRELLFFRLFVVFSFCLTVGLFL